MSIKEFKNNIGVMLISGLILSLFAVTACGGGGAGGSSDGQTYVVTYDDNNADSGTVPVDNTEYANGQNVTVSDNTGNLVKNGFKFDGWCLTTPDSGTEYEAGQSFIMGSADVTFYAKWLAPSWSNMEGGVNGYVSSLICDSSDNLYVGGTFTTAGGVSVANVAKWNGTTWSALGSGIDGTVSILTGDTSGNIYAVYRHTVSFTTTRRIAKWNGTSWADISTTADGDIKTLVCDSAGNLYAGGNFSSINGVSANYIAKWNGIAWSAYAPGLNSFVEVLIFDSAEDLYAGGSFTTAGAVTVNKIAKWNGTSWSALGTGITAPSGSAVDTLVFDNSGNLYAGGDFDTAGGITVNGIAMWNGASWSSLDGGIGDGGFIESLFCDSSGNIYASGSFSEIGGISIFNLAKWDGDEWLSDLSGGPNGVVVVDSKGNVYAGDYTGLLGDDDLYVYGLAKWGF